MSCFKIKPVKTVFLSQKNLNQGNTHILLISISHQTYNSVDLIFHNEVKKYIYDYFLGIKLYIFHQELSDHTI